MLRVYLAGGFRTDWQETVKMECQGLEAVQFLDPKEKERGAESPKIFQQPNVYTNWDLLAIEQSDVVFAYVENTNPAVGVIAEIGFATGRRIPVIFVKDPEDTSSYFKDKYFDFVRNMPQVMSFNNLSDGIDCLNSIHQILSR